MTESGPWEFSLTPLASKFVSCASLASETDSLLKSLEEILLSVDCSAKEEFDSTFDEFCQLKLEDIDWPFCNDESPCLTSTPIKPIIKILSHRPTIPAVILSFLFRVFDDEFELFKLSEPPIDLLDWTRSVSLW